MQFLTLGGSEVSVPAFLQGQVQAVATVPPYAFQLQSKGYRTLSTVVGDPYLGNGYVALRSRLDELAPQLSAFVAATRDGVLAYKQQPELAKQIIPKYTGEADPDVLQKTYDFYLTSAPFDSSMKANDQSLQVMLDYLAETLIPAAKDAKPSQFYDWRFVDKLPPL